MNIKQLQYFIAVVREGSFSAAAKSLGISQPPLSSQIKLLEEELETELLERGCRPVKLTQAGELLYLRACTLTDLAKAMVEELRGSTGGRETLRIGTVTSSATALLESRLPHFAREHPDVSFSLAEGNTYELIEQLKNGLIDLAVVRTPFRERDLQCAYLEPEPMAAVGKLCFFPEDAGESLTLAKLAHTPLIFYRRFEHLLLSAFQESGVRPQVFCKNDDARTTLLWADAGLGVALAPLSICRLMRREGTQILPLNEPALFTRIAVIRQKGRPLSPAGEAFFGLFLPPTCSGGANVVCCEKTRGDFS